MLWTVRKEELANKLQLIGGVVGRKQTLPILSHILWEVCGQQARITAADMELELTTDLLLENGDPTGKIALPGKKFMDIIRSAPPQSLIVLEEVGGKIEVRYTQSQFALAPLPAAQFPVMKTDSEWNELIIPQNKLKWLIERTQFSIAKEEVRYYLSSMLLELEGRCLRSTTSDGHRISYAEWDEDLSGYKGLCQILLSRRVVTEIDRLLAHSSEKIALRVTSESFFQLKTEQVTLTTKRVEGRVPYYLSAFSDDPKWCITVNREELKQALARAAILSYSEESTIQFKIMSGKLVILVGQERQDKAEIEVATNYSGETLEMTFNIFYLLEAISVLDKPKVRLLLKDLSAGMIIEEIGLETDRRHRHMVMPICE